MMKEKYEFAREKMQTVSGQAREKMQTVSGQVREKVSRFTDTLGRAREKREEFSQAAAYRRSRLAERARERRAQWRGGLQTAIEEQPLALGALVFSIGAAVGAILPATRKEARLLSEQREQFFEKTEEMAREQLEKAKESARQAGEAVETELKKRFQGGPQQEERSREKEPAL